MRLQSLVPLFCFGVSLGLCKGNSGVIHNLGFTLPPSLRPFPVALLICFNLILSLSSPQSLTSGVSEAISVGLMIPSCCCSSGCFLPREAEEPETQGSCLCITRCVRHGGRTFLKQPQGDFLGRGVINTGMI